MSGTKAHKKRESNKFQVEYDKLVSINSNRTSLLQMTITELVYLYGAENVNSNHPLFSSIQSSADGVLIDLIKLSEDITAFNAVEV